MHAECNNGAGESGELLSLFRGTHILVNGVQMEGCGVMAGPVAGCRVRSLVGDVGPDPEGDGVPSRI